MKYMFSEMPQIKSITKDKAEHGISTKKQNGNDQNNGQPSSHETHSGDDGTIALIQSNNSSHQSEIPVGLNVENGKIKGGWSDIKRKMTTKKAVKIFKEAPSAKKKKKEDNLGVVFMGIISIFIGKSTIH